MPEHLKRRAVPLAQHSSYATGNTKKAVAKSQPEDVKVEMAENDDDGQPLIPAQPKVKFQEDEPLKQELKFQEVPLKHRRVILPFLNEMYIMACFSFAFWVISVVFSMCIASGR